MDADAELAEAFGHQKFFGGVHAVESVPRQRLAVGEARGEAGSGWLVPGREAAFF